MPQTRILLTGADTYIGSHILHILASDNNLSIRVTVESGEKAHSIQQQYRHRSESTLDFTVVPGKGSPRAGTLDNALSENVDACHTIIHTLSARASEETDCLARFINLESDAVIGFLRSVHQLARQVKRVVIVSTLTPFARWLQVEGYSGKGFDGPSSNVDDPEYVLATSQAGNNIVYEAVSKWVRDTGVAFDVVYITAPSCYGPTVLPLETSSDLFEGNRRIWNICGNEQRQRLGAPPYGITQFLDVRDLAFATVRALSISNAGNKRFSISSGSMPSGSEIAEFLVSYFPELRGCIRMNGSPPYQPSPDDPTLDFFNTRMAASILQIPGFRSVEDTLVDTARQILELQRRKEWRSIIQS